MRICDVDGCDKPARPRRHKCAMHLSRLLRTGTLDAPPVPSVEERFWAKVDKTGRCWLWTASASAGYGLFTERRGGRTATAHRWAWEFTHGPIPSGLVVNHLCRTRMCVRPDHLEVITQAENLRYSDQALGIRSAATACVHGHPYTAENTYVRPQGWRRCLTCYPQTIKETA